MHKQHEPRNITPIETWQILGAMFWTLAPMVHVPPPTHAQTNHSYDILGARMLWKPKETRILKNFIEF